MRKNVKLSLVFNVLIVSMLVASFSQKETLSLFASLDYYACTGLVALVSSLLMIIFILNKKEINEIPFVVMVIRYVSSVALVLGLKIEVLIINPMEYGLSNYFYGLGVFFSGISGLFLHLLCPLMLALSFIFFEGDRRLNKKKTMYYPLMLTLVYVLLVVVLSMTNVIVAPYEFLRVNDHPFYISLCWMVVVMVVNYLVARYCLLFNQMKAPRIKIKH